MPRNSTKDARAQARKRFDSVFSETGDYREACRAAGVSERTGRRWRDATQAPERGTPSLPPQGSSCFVGRSTELADLSKRVRDGRRLITVLGPPGIGKSRLVAHWLHRALHQADFDLIYCDLRHAKNATDLLTAAALELGVQIDGNDERVGAALGRAIRARSRCFLVLDPLEPLVGHATNILTEWLRVAPELVVIAVSRTVLNAKDESILELSPLGIPDGPSAHLDALLGASDAARMFWTRALDAEPSLAQTPVDPTDVASVVMRLEGIPLALELAAAQLRRVSVTELVNDAHDPLSFHSFHRDGDPDHASLAAAVDRSWQLLSYDERIVLAQLSVFRGGFTGESIDAVVDPGPASPGSPLEVIGGLREASLLRTESRKAQHRRWDFFDATRSFAAKRLDELGMRHAAERRHAQYFLAEGRRRAELLITSEAESARRWLTNEINNLRAAFEHWENEDAAADESRLEMAWVVQTVLVNVRPHGALEVASRALTSLGGEVEPSKSELRVRLARAIAERELGRTEAATTSIRNARSRLKLAELSGTVAPQDTIRIRAALDCEEAMAKFYEGGVTAAERVLRSAIDRVAGTRVTHEEGRLRSILAWVLAEGRRSPEAFKQHALAVDLLAKSGDAFRSSIARRTWAAHRVFFRRGRARESLVREAEYLQELGAPKEAGYALAVLSMEALDRGQINEARRYGEQTLVLANRLGHRRLLGMGALALSPALVEAGENDTAIEVLENARTAIAAASDRRTEALIALYLGGALCLAGRRQEAEMALADAESLAEGTGDLRLPALSALQRGHVDVLDARAALADGTIGPALASLHRARQSAGQVRTRLGDDSPLLEECDVEARHLSRMLHREIARISPDTWDVRVADDGSGYQVGEARFRHLPPGAVLRRVFLELVKSHIASPGEAISTEELLSLGWPGERMRGDTGLRRVRDVLLRLRQAGLEGVILTGGEGGYLIEPELTLDLVADPQAAIRRKRIPNEPGS